MKRVLLSALVAVVLLPGVVGAAPPTSVADRVSLLVMFDGGVPGGRQAALHTLAGARVTGELPDVGVARVSVPIASAQVYVTSDLVRAVETPRDLQIMGSKPNDPLIKLQWSLRKVDAFRAWQIESGKRADVQVAVIDTGVDATHVDLKGRVLAGFDFLEKDDDTYDDNGHGTHVSGIIAANASNHEGIAGLSQGASIIPMKACTGLGACDIFAVYASAIDAVRLGADVLNLSLGGAGPCTEIDQAVFDWVRDQGALTVVSTGNSGADGNPDMSPANCNFTLGVGAIDERGKRAEFSSYGDFVDIAAPGVQVWSTVPPLISILSSHIGYLPFDGTSMAAPHVAGAAALIKAHHPDWTPAQIEKKLLSSATDAGKKGRDDFYGAGILDLYEALK